MTDSYLPLLDEQVAIITGGGRGIGKAAALTMARAGAKVALVARSAGEVEQASRELNQAGCDAIGISADISNADMVARVVDKVFTRYGTVDILVNNASVIEPFGFTWETDVDAWRRLMEINVFGTFLCCRAVLPEMLAKTRGRIINISSGVADYNLTGTSAYNASKAALERFSGTLAAEVEGRGIVVTALRPGKVDTRMQVEIRATSPERFPRVQEWTDVHQKGELLHPSVPARAILWLASRFGAAENGKTFAMKSESFRALLDRDLP